MFEQVVLPIIGKNSNSFSLMVEYVAESLSWEVAARGQEGHDVRDWILEPGLSPVEEQGLCCKCAM